jgi:hypothetical protein
MAIAITAPIVGRTLSPPSSGSTPTSHRSSRRGALLWQQQILYSRPHGSKACEDGWRDQTPALIGTGVIDRRTHVHKVADSRFTRAFGALTSDGTRGDLGGGRDVRGL